LWPGQALYAGPGLDLDPHSGSVWCLAVGVDGPLTVTADGVRIVARSVLIPPRLTHHLGSRGGRLVSCYLDPTSDRASSCRARFRDSRGDLAAGHLDEAELAAVPVDDESAGHWLAVAAPATPHLIDPRIALAAKLIREDPAASASSRQLAEHVGLSESRFLHLFRHEVGTSLRRYRLWVRLMHAGSSISAGQNLTTAAADAGFASPSHLADKFKSTFGLTASQLLATGLRVNAPGIAQEG
jgi:AraC-like DNA-binding protein